MHRNPRTFSPTDSDRPSSNREWSARVTSPTFYARLLEQAPRLAGLYGPAVYKSVGSRFLNLQAERFNHLHGFQKENRKNRRGKYFAPGTAHFRFIFMLVMRKPAHGIDRVTCRSCPSIYKRSGRLRNIRTGVFFFYYFLEFSDVSVITFSEMRLAIYERYQLRS